jgi:hypothetical protein
MMSTMRGVFPYIAGVALALGLASAAQNSLVAPNMSVCLVQVDRSSAAIGEFDSDVLTCTLVVSSALSGSAQRIWDHKGSFYPDEPPSTVNSMTVTLRNLELTSGGFVRLIHPSSENT